MLNQLRIEAIDEAIKQYDLLLQEIKRINAPNDGLQEIVDMINKHTYLDAVEALFKINKIKNYVVSVVDLGLSVRWTTCNAGAKRPEEEGKYYTYDEAIANFKGKLPTKEQWEELKNKCRWEWTTQNGVNGYKVTGPNGNSIFLPAAGERFINGDVYNVGEIGEYWSFTPYAPDNAWRLFFNSRGDMVHYTIRWFCLSVRLVQ